jgi:hypothetical protein
VKLPIYQVDAFTGQLSARGGELDCTLVGDRVLIAGRTVAYLRGEIEI